MSDNYDIRGLQYQTGGGGAREVFAQTAEKHLIVAQGGPTYMERSRLSEGWTVQLASGVAPLVAPPTTVAALELYNNSRLRVMVIRDLFIFRLLGTAAAQTYSLWAQVTTTKAVPTLGALVLHSLSGKSSQTPTAESEAVTATGSTVVANGFRPYGPPVPYVTEAALPNTAFSVEINGRIIVPQGSSLCLHAVGATTAGTVVVGCTFDWVTMTVEP